MSNITKPILKGICWALLLPGACLGLSDDTNFLTFPSYLTEPKENIIKAEEFFQAALYRQAIPLYQQALAKETSAAESKSIRYRLAQSYFFMEDYGSTIDVLAAIEDIFAEKNHKELFLIGLAYSKAKSYDNAIPALKKYLSFRDSVAGIFYDEALFELGQAYFFGGKLTEAKDCFLDSSKTQKVSIRHHSLLYLARIALTENDKTGKELLQKLKSLITQDNPLRFEVSFIQGEFSYRAKDYFPAVESFEHALSISNPDKTSWYADALLHLGESYLHSEEQKNMEKAEHYFQILFDYLKNEKSLLALGQCYLTRARCLKDNMYYQKAETLFQRRDLLVSREGRARATLLLAESAPSYETRDLLYRRLTQESNKDVPSYSIGWYLRGINDYEEGKKLNEPQEALKAYERAIPALKTAFDLLKEDNKPLAGLAMLYQAMALESQGSVIGSSQALATLDLLLNQFPDILISLNAPDEVYYRHALVATHLAEQEDRYFQIAHDSLERGLKRFPEGKFADAMLHLKGTLYFRQHQYRQALDIFVKLIENRGKSELASDYLYWAARSADGLDEASKSREFRRKVFEEFNLSPWAAEAYFSYYSYRDYLQGDRLAIKHLQAMPEKYPDSYWLLHAWYLIGIDQKRDRKSESGRWLTKKNLTNAIDAFQNVETLFDRLFEKGMLPEDQLDKLIAIRYRATLERALTNMTIADESQGTKKQIFLEYAEGVLDQFIQDFTHEENPIISRLINTHIRSRLEEEGTYWLAQAKMKTGKDGLADTILVQMLEKYQSGKITRGYFLSRVWYDRGILAMKRNEYAVALKYFKQAEDAAKGNVLNTDQKLDLWIQQSCCYQALNDLENTILILSKVINDDAISGLRIKAMYLRAEAYELQNRRPVAKKQLEATATKGGEWALKAKEKLGKEYGYQ